MGDYGAKSRAEVIETTAFREIIGDSETGYYGEDGDSGYQGMPQVFVALLGNRHGRMVLLVASLELNNSDLFRRVVSSFQFLAN